MCHVINGFYCHMQIYCNQVPKLQKFIKDLLKAKIVEAMASMAATVSTVSQKQHFIAFKLAFARQ